MNVTVRKGKKEDLTQVHALIKELAVFEKAPQEVTNTVADMEHDFFGEHPVFMMHVAEAENKIVGMAIYFIKYSTWKGKGIYLDDIVVNEKFRRNKIGRKLFEAVIEESKRLKAKQLHWQVLDWNTPAIEFYKKYNPGFDREWVNCKMTEQQILEFTGE